MTARRWPTMPRFRHVCGPDDICECRARWETEGDRRYDQWKDAQDEDRWDEEGEA